MKKILFVAPSSYPVNGPESMVNAKHIYVLCKMGYIVDVITRGVNKRHVFYPSDECNVFFSKVNSINEVPVDTKMNLATLVRHLMTFLKTGHVYKGADWTFPALRKAEQLCKVNKYDFVFTKDYPSEIVGLYLSKKYGIKWISTWNDPYMIEKYPSPYGLGYNFKESFMRHRLIKQISTRPFVHLFPSSRLRDYMLKYMVGMDVQKCYVMPHILLDSDVKKTSKSFNEELNIIHTGSVGRERNPQNFLKALSIVLNEHPEWKIRTTFLGIVDRTKGTLLYDLIERYHLQEYIEILKPIPYEECMDFVKKYDLCLIVEANCEEGIFLPSKVIDYLQNEKPILTVSPSSGVLYDLYSNGVVDYFGDVNDVMSIKRAIESAYLDEVRGLNIKNKDLTHFSEQTIIKLHEKILR